MVTTLDKEKVLECMFDPITSEILAELENGGKESSYLVGKLKISGEKIQNKLSYLLKHDFVEIVTRGGKTVYSANLDKLAKILEEDKNFQGVVDGLTEMDSYLN